MASEASRESGRRPLTVTSGHTEGAAAPTAGLLKTMGHTAFPEINAPCLALVLKVAFCFKAEIFQGHFSKPQASSSAPRGCGRSPMGGLWDPALALSPLTYLCVCLKHGLTNGLKYLVVKGVLLKSKNRKTKNRPPTDGEQY